MEKIVEVSGLTKKFKNLTAVDNLMLNVYKGDVFGFLGPNGAGKSTTIRMLLSLIKPTAGKIKIFGKNLFAHRTEILRNVGAIVEKPDFYLYLSAYKNLEILGKISSADVSKNNIMKNLELVGLTDRASSKVKTFSHGMKQRLGLAQALLHNPELIILDEPTTGLDPQGIKEIRELIIYLSKEEGKTIFLSSHILKEVELIASRMIIINKGKTLIEGKVNELINSEQNEVAFEFTNPDSAIDLIINSQWNSNFKSKEGNKIIFSLSQNHVPGLNKFFVENNIEILSIVPIHSLEDYFFKITEGAEK